MVLVSARRVTDWVWQDSPDWSHHRLGKNYLAKIKVNPNAPGGLEREFQPLGAGKKGFVIRELAPGDPCEIGSTDVDPMGKAIKHRTYIVVTSLSKNSFDYVPFQKPEAAIEYAQRFINTLPTEGGPIATLQRQLRAIGEQREKLQIQETEIRAQIKELLAGQVEAADADLGGTNADTQAIAKELVEEVTPESTGLDRVVVPNAVQAASSLHGGNGVVNQGLPVEKLAGPAPVKAPPAPPAPPAQDDEDDEDEGLTPAQKAVLARMNS